MIFVGLGLALLAISGAPLFTIIAASAMWGFYREEIDLSVIAVEVFRIAEMPVLLAIPLFTFAGYLLSESNAPSRLVKMTRALIGWMPGGLAVVALAVCALFTAFTGASGVTIIALGALLYPALIEDGYDEKFSLGLVTTSGSLGLLFAPSLPLILYGIVAQQTASGSSVSIDRLFLAGVFPGILMVLLLSGWAVWRNRHLRLPLSAFSTRGLMAAARESMWDIPLPVIVLGGIYSGFFAVSEAATVTVVYVLLVEVLILREIKLKELPDIVRKSMALVGGIMVILGLSLASTTYMIDAGVPDLYRAANLDLLGDARVHDRCDPIAPDARVDPGATVMNTIVGSGAVIEAGTTVVDTVVLPGAFIGARAQVESSLVMGRIEPDATVIEAVIGADGVVAEGDHVAYDAVPSPD